MHTRTHRTHKSVCSPMAQMGPRVLFFCWDKVPLSQEGDIIVILFTACGPLKSLWLAEEATGLNPITSHGYKNIIIGIVRKTMKTPPVTHYSTSYSWEPLPRRPDASATLELLEAVNVDRSLSQEVKSPLKKTLLIGSRNLIFLVLLVLCECFSIGWQ